MNQALVEQLKIVAPVASADALALEGVVTDTYDEYWPFVKFGMPASGLSLPPRGDLGPDDDDPLQAALRLLDGKRVRVTIEVLPD